MEAAEPLPIVALNPSPLKPEPETYLVRVRQGQGLVEAAERTPILAHVVGALWELHDLAALAKGNHANCGQLDTFGQDVLRAFDFHGEGLSLSV